MAPDELVPLRGGARIGDVAPGASAPRRRRFGDAAKIAGGLCVLFALGVVVRPAPATTTTTEVASSLDATPTTTPQLSSSSSSSSSGAAVASPPTVVVTARTVLADDVAWADFKRTYGKTYATPRDEAMKRANFARRVEELAALNAKNGAPVFGITHATDRDAGTRAYARGRVPPTTPPSVPVDILGLDEWVAAHQATMELRNRAILADGVVDWRAVDGLLTPVKNQGQCGSCWAFSAAEQVEAQYVLAGGAWVDLSPQQITSCTATCAGCGGGDTTAAFEYLMTQPGLAPEAFWPYLQGLTPKGECVSPRCTKPCDRSLDALAIDYFYIGPSANVTGYSFAVPPCAGACDAQDLGQLAAVVALMPVSICVNAENWDDYVGGVMTVDTCGGYSYDDLDHCVQLVGYNASSHDGAYWIVRNSWSTSWGQEGYIYLQFDANTCGLADEATVVTVEPPIPELSVLRGA